MSFLPSDSAIKLSAEQEKKISGMDHNEILEYMRDLALEQNLVTPDPFDSTGRTILHPVALADNAPKRVAKTITFNGVKHVLEADDEAGLLAKENEIYRAALAQPTAAPAAAPAEAQAEPTVTAEEADVVERYLKAQGISPESLRANSDKAYEKSWAASTQEFLASDAGADWPGGDANRIILGQTLIQLGLTDSPSADSIAKAYQYARENNLLVENPETKALRDRDAAIASASSDAEIRRLAGLDPERGLRYQYQGENWNG